jgi:hypothetical protein
MLEPQRERAAQKCRGRRGWSYGIHRMTNSGGCPPSVVAERHIASKCRDWRVQRPLLSRTFSSSAANAVRTVSHLIWVACATPGFHEEGCIAARALGHEVNPAPQSCCVSAALRATPAAALYGTNTERPISTRQSIPDLPLPRPRPQLQRLGPRKADGHAPG